MGLRSILVIGIVGSTAYGEPPPIDDAIKQAAVAKKPLVLEFHAAWCGPCQTFAATTLTDERVKHALDGVVFVRYDAEQDPGIAAAARYGVTAYPTFIVLDRNGAERLRERGALGGEAGVRQFLDLLARARAVPVATLSSATRDQRARRLKQWKQQLIAEKLAIVRRAREASLDDLIVVTIGSDLRQAQIRPVLRSAIEHTQDIERLDKLVYIALAAGAKEEALRAATRINDHRRDGKHLSMLAECYHAWGDRPRALELADEAIETATGADELVEELKASRQRFEHGKEEPTEVVELRARAADLWQRVENVDHVIARAATPVAIPKRSATQSSTYQRYAAAHLERQRVENAVEAACRKHAGSRDEAVARIALDAQGNVISVKLLVEANASSALRACLRNEISLAKLPQQTQLPGNSSLDISF